MSPVGQTDAQAWSRSTSNDEPVPIGERAAATVPLPTPTVGSIQLPAGSTLVVSKALDEIPDLPDSASSPPEMQSVTVGLERVYENTDPYGVTVDLVEDALVKASCHPIQRTRTRTTTVWKARCSRGHTVHVAVRSTQPTTIQVVDEPAQ